MENASKALLIAGGILLAMLTASLLVLLNNNIQTIENAKSEKIAQEQRTAFNREYEAYNKKIMYGTDVITVVNKAIDNNIMMNNTEEPQNAYYVNVVFNVITDFEYEKYKTKVDKTIETMTNTSIEKSLYKGEYELGRWNRASYSMKNDIVTFFKQRW